VIAHWDDVAPYRRDLGHLRGEWTDLGRAAGSIDVGVRRIRMAPREIPTPAHVHPAEEEIFYVLRGSGLSWQDGKTHEIREGDAIVHIALREAHTLRAGEDGLDVLAFGHRMRTPGAYVPNAQRFWLNPSWTEVGQQPPPFEAEPELDWPEPSPRPPNIVNAEAVAGDYEGRWKRLGADAGSVQTGLNLATQGSGEDGADPHCHSADEEIFVVLAGSGRMELWPAPLRAAHGAEREEHPIRAGHTISRPPGTGIGHYLVAGDDGMTYLAYGTRRPDDVCYYPRANQVYFRGLGVLTELPIVAPEE